MSTQEQQLHDLSFIKVRDFIYRNYDEVVTPQQVALGLLDFENTHGEKAIIAMFGFMCWAWERGRTAKDIYPTIIHDFNGRNDKVMLPKTADYYPYALLGQLIQSKVN